MESAQTSKTALLKRTALFVIILAVAGALLASYWFISSRNKSSEKSNIVESSSVSAQRTREDDLCPLFLPENRILLISINHHPPENLKID